jgi:hypothetical protein
MAKASRSRNNSGVGCCICRKERRRRCRGALTAAWRQPVSLQRNSLAEIENSEPAAGSARLSLAKKPKKRVAGQRFPVFPADSTGALTSSAARLRFSASIRLTTFGAGAAIRSVGTGIPARLRSCRRWPDGLLRFLLRCALAGNRRLSQWCDCSR